MRMLLISAVLAIAVAVGAVSSAAAAGADPTTSRTVAKDGGTLTSKTKITTATGEKSENALVFDRQ